MIKIHIHVDTRAASRARSASAVVTGRGVLYTLLAALLVLPVVATASPLNVPNAFEADTVISSSDMNANFDAVAASVDDNDGRIVELEAEIKPHDCEWAAATGSASTSVIVTCPANKYAIAGSCRVDGGGAVLRYSLAGDASVGSYPADGDLPTAVDTWSCGWDAAANHYGQALCCAF